MSRSKEAELIFHQNATETSAHVKYAMAYISRLFAKSSRVEFPLDVTNKEDLKRNPYIIFASPKFPLYISDSGNGKLTEAQYLWTAAMVFGEKLNFDNKSIKTDWDSEIHFEVGSFTRYSKSSLYETQFKHYLKPYMFKISKTAALYEDIPGILKKKEQIKLQKKRHTEEIGLSKEEIRQKREEERPRFIQLEEDYKQEAILKEQEINRRREKIQEKMALREKERIQKRIDDEKREEIRKQKEKEERDAEYNYKQKGFREKREQVKYYMAMASRKLANRDKPTPDRPIYLSDGTIDEVVNQWTAFMIFGEKLGFDNNSIIKDGLIIMDFKNQMGIFSRFSNNSIYERVFKNHLKSNMLEISKNAALYDDISGFLSEAEQVKLNINRQLNEIGLSEKEIAQKRNEKKPLERVKDERYEQQNEYMDDDNDERRFFRKQAANVKYALAIASRRLADHNLPTLEIFTQIQVELKNKRICDWIAFIPLGEKLGFTSDLIKASLNKTLSIDSVQYLYLLETEFKHHIKPYMLEISKTAALFDDISGLLSETEQIELNKNRELDERGLSEDEIEQKREQERAHIGGPFYLEHGTNFHENMEQKKQRRILINAVNKYLRWLENSLDDHQEKEVTFLMRLHHLTAFEKKRATHFKTVLISHTASNPIELLQNHFKEDSILNDYSLDTYLLEGILSNTHLFLISEKFDDLKTIELREQLQNLILSQPLYSDTEYAFKLGQLYEDDTDAEEHLEKACKYYAIAMQGNHEFARVALEMLAQKGFSEAQYCIGTQYHHRRSDIKLAITWCMLAAEQQHIDAYTYLTTTEFSVEQYLAIAKQYDQGDGVNQNIITAMIFYEKACALNDMEAALRLGTLYQPNLNICQSLPIKDAKKSFNYYLIAAKQKNEAALDAMIQITENTTDNDLILDLASTFLNIFENPEAAFTHFKKLADEKNNTAIARLDYYANCDGNHAHIIGKLYENDGRNLSNTFTACKYYLLGIKKDDKKSYVSLVNLATNGCSEAQFIMGSTYSKNKQLVGKAIKWCLRAAEQKHPQAITYLFNTQFSIEHYLKIANAYSNGTVVQKNTASAIIFYEKASALNCNEATLFLGQFYHQSNPKKSFHYFLILAKQKNENALEHMKNIVKQYEDNELKFTLANVYLDVFDNSSAGIAYLKDLADRDFSKGREKLHSLADANPDHAYVIAQLYQKENNLRQASMFYAIAMRKNHKASHVALKSILQVNNSEAQYAIGFYFYHYTHQIENAIHWCLLAAEQQHKDAIVYLFNTQFEAKHHYEIAKKYEQGNEVTKNLHFAVEFYKKACALNHKDAAIRLGELFQIKSDDKDNFNHLIKKDNLNAFNYYLIAAKQKDKFSLDAMVKIASRSNDNKLKLCLANLYLNVFEAPEIALNYFKITAEIDCKEASEQLKILTKNPEYACIMAKLYEEETRTESNLQLAAYYYVLAIQYSDSEIYKEIIQRQLNELLRSAEISEKVLINIGELFYTGQNGIFQNYAQAIIWYEQACTKNSAIAHYFIGVMYENAYGVEQNIVTAIRYFQLADDKGHAIAKTKIDTLLNSNKRTSLELTTIALMYQNGSYGVIKNYSRVVMLYQKASAKGDKIAAFDLGHFHQLDHDELPKDNHLAFESYLRAATLLNHDALIPLERLGEDVSAEEQLALSHLYGSIFHNKEKQNYWREKATEIEQFSFKNLI